MTLVSPSALAAGKPKTPPLPRVGDVLIAGGIAPGGSATSSAEFYSVAKHRFFPTGAMSTARAGHQTNWAPASPERTKNHGVAIGGFTGTAALTGTSITYTMTTLNNADVYDPATGTFTLDQAPEGATMTNGRAFFSSIAFPGNLSTQSLQGHMLIVGGLCDSPTLDGCRTANILHPDDDKITTTSNPKVANMLATLTNLQDGTVLLAGGIEDFSGSITNTGEIFTPPNEFFTTITALMTQARAGHTATLLNDGTVLITGGIVNVSGTMTAVNTAEIYNPTSQTFTAITAPMNASRVGHTATLLNDGTVLIAGGFNGTANVTLAGTVDGDTLTFSNANGSILNTAEIYDPTTMTFACVGGPNKNSGQCSRSLRSPRVSHTATELADGSVLLTGGFSPGKKNTITELNTGELFVQMPKKNSPGVSIATGKFINAGKMTTGRALHTATLVQP